MSAWSKVGGFLKKNGAGILGVAGAVVTGNVPAGVAMVASMVTEATGENDPTKALASLKSNPDAMIRLKEIAQRNEADLRRHESEMFKLQIADIDSARDRESKTGDSLTPRLLSAGVVFGFFGVLSFLLISGKPNVGGDAFLILLGALGASFTQVINYYFGSSAGSSKKDNIMMAKGMRR